MTDHADTRQSLDAQRADEVERVYRWRKDELERVGYPVALAETLAGREDIDLHRAVEMVEKGCDPLVAGDVLL